MSVRVAPGRRPAVTRSRADTVAAALAAGLVVAAAVVGGVLYLTGRPVHVPAPPLFGHWRPHVGPGTPLAVTVAGLVVAVGPRLALRLAWPRLMVLSYAAAVAWILSLALIDGVRRGLVGRLTTDEEYLSEVGGVTDVATMLRGFTGRILDFQPDSWTTHVSGHPPGALLVFVGLDRIGLGGGAWAALACVLVGALSVVAVPVTLRAVGTERAARAAVPFLVLFPGAVWIGASADGLFTGVTACAVASLAIGLTRAGWVGAGWCAGSGALLAAGCYLSYGLVLLAPVALVVLVCAVRAGSRVVGPMAAAGVGALAVVAAFTGAGFWWWDGYQLVVQRYYQGVASHRPYFYWVWANLAALVLSAGPVAAVVVRRAAVAGRDRGPGPAVVYLLPLGALLAVLGADLSGLSKSEVERIWLPFAVWLLAGAALLAPASRRCWLAVQAGTALAVNHLLLTTW